MKWIKWIKNKVMPEEFVSSGDSTIMHLLRQGSPEKIRTDEISPNQVEYKNKKDETFLSLAIKMDAAPLALKILKKYPEYINQTCLFNEETLLMVAVRYNNFIVYKYLIDNGADLNYVSPHGETVLNLTMGKPEYNNYLVSQTRLNILKPFPTHRHPLINLHASETSLMFLIKNGMLQNSSMPEVIKIVKHHLKLFNHKVIEEIFKHNLFNCYETDLNNVFLDSGEGLINGKMLIHSENHESFDYYNSKLEFLHKKIGITNKFIAKSMYQKVIKVKYPLIYDNLLHINYELLSALEFAKTEFNSIDENLLRPIIEKDNSFLIEKQYYKPLKEMLSFYNEKRAVSILAENSNNHEFKDTLYMFEQLKRYAKANDIKIEELIPRSPHRMRDFHDTFQNLISKIGRNNIPIHANLSLEIKNLDNKKFEEFYLYVPKNNAELIVVGQQMCICVGNNDYYAEEMARGKNVILLLKKNNKVQYCIEYNSLAQIIIQAKTYYNTEMDKSVRDKLDKFLKQQTLCGPKSDSLI